MPPTRFAQSIYKHSHCDKFQLCTSSGFWVIGELINFQAKNRRFFCFFVCQFTITRPRIPKIGTHNAFINSYVKSKFQLSRLYCLLVMIINPHLPKFANKNTGTTRYRQITTTKQIVHYTFMRELTANNFYLRNCLDLKPVPIIRFIFQLGFRHSG